MNKELPQPTIIAIVVLFVVLVAGVGWLYMNHNSDRVATVAGQRGTMATAPHTGARTSGKPLE